MKRKREDNEEEKNDDREIKNLEPPEKRRKLDDSSQEGKELLIFTFLRNNFNLAAIETTLSNGALTFKEKMKKASEHIHQLAAPEYKAVELAFRIISAKYESDLVLCSAIAKIFEENEDMEDEDVDDIELVEKIKYLTEGTIVKNIVYPALSKVRGEVNAEVNKLNKKVWDSSVGGHGGCGSPSSSKWANIHPPQIRSTSNVYFAINGTIDNPLKYEIVINDSDTIVDLKKRLAGLISIEAEQMLLVDGFCGDFLPDDEYFGSCCLRANSTIRVLDRSNYMKIFVKTMTGKTITVRALHGFTVSDTKNEIKKLEGIPVSQQRHIFAGRQLEDTRCLKDYGIVEDSTIHLILRLRGGKPVILLYPPTPLANATVTAEINQDVWNFDCYYPKIEGIGDPRAEKAIEWNVSNVQPNGFFHFKNVDYRYLFYETLTKNSQLFKFDTAKPVYVVRREIVCQFLQEYLSKSEQMKMQDVHDMITYWMKELEEKSFVMLQFMDQGKLDDLLKLKVQPQPDLVKRVFMMFRPVEPVGMSIQSFLSVDYNKHLTVVEKKEDFGQAIPEGQMDVHNGFVVFEWGGMNLSKNE